MIDIEVRDITKIFPAVGRGTRAVTALDEVTCSIKRGEMFFLLGPSGCGKTTLLRILAGFVRPTTGRVFFGGRDVTRTGPNKRKLAMVFQNYALWPHMTVAGNVSFGPRTAGWKGRDRKAMVKEMLELVDMTDRRRHKPGQLSGGQQQRVALARALAVKPEGLLLDEPLSNLDARLRARMRGQIRRLVKKAGATAVYVTHDQEEALSMADRIAVMDAGRIVQVGAPLEIYRRPANRFVAEFLGEANFFSGAVIGRDGKWMLVETPSGRLRAASADVPVGTDVTCCFRPEMVRVGGQAVEGDSELSATCMTGTYFGHTTRYEIAIKGNRTMHALLAGPQAVVEPQQALTVRIAAEDVTILDYPLLPGTERSSRP